MTNFENGMFHDIENIFYNLHQLHSKPLFRRTASKVSVFGVALVHIFPHSDWIRRHRIHPECWKIHTRITPITDTFHTVTHTGIFPSDNIYKIIQYLHYNLQDAQKKTNAIDFERLLHNLQSAILLFKWFIFCYKFLPLFL